jgi:2-keto-3-deoxy-L-rhamnonate aldolase RhmA
MGLIVPDVATADQARQVVAASLYPPAGRRSMGGASPVFNFRALPLPESTRALNQGTLICCMIETREGVRNMAEIAAVDGVDVLHIGCNDLLGDLGKMGQFQDPELLDIIAGLIAACRANGKFAGLGGEKDPARQAQYIRDGIRFVTTTSDIGFISEGAKRVVGTLRSAV